MPCSKGWKSSFVCESCFTAELVIVAVRPIRPYKRFVRTAALR
jgi:hypothetical protein